MRRMMINLWWSFGALLMKPTITTRLVANITAVYTFFYMAASTYTKKKTS